tara:strand:+ start:763 stop:900 length:138 start_codon:yes stop_codon:yes gene_type:complete
MGKESKMEEEGSSCKVIKSIPVSVRVFKSIRYLRDAWRGLERMRN